MKTLLKIFLVLTIAYSDHIQLWVDEVQYIAPSADDLFLKIQYSIVNTDSGIQLLDENGEDVNNIKSFRFTLGTFNDLIILNHFDLH